LSEGEENLGIAKEQTKVRKEISEGRQGKRCGTYLLVEIQPMHQGVWRRLKIRERISGLLNPGSHP